MPIGSARTTFGPKYRSVHYICLTLFDKVTPHVLKEQHHMFFENGIPHVQFTVYSFHLFVYKEHKTDKGKS